MTPPSSGVRWLVRPFLSFRLVGLQEKLAAKDDRCLKVGADAADPSIFLALLGRSP